MALFSFILVNNLFGQLFVFMFPTFSKIGYAYGLAILSYLVYNAAGTLKYGFGNYMRRMTLPEGVPVALWPLIIPLEFLSNFIVRPVTAMRLFGNLFAGHLVIMVFVVGGSMLLTMTEPAAGFRPAAEHRRRGLAAVQPGDLRPGDLGRDPAGLHLHRPDRPIHSAIAEEHWTDFVLEATERKHPMEITGST